MLALVLNASIAFQQPPPPDEIHVDDRCRIVTQDRPGPYGAFNKPQYRTDTSICSTRGVKKSSHWEQTLYDGVVKRTKVEIHEWQFYLHNPTNQAIAFVLELSIPDGWVFDSNPQPVSVEDHVGTFRVFAKPGDTLTLHIGERH